jgi:hypothetical protein
MQEIAVSNSPVNTVFQHRLAHLFPIINPGAVVKWIFDLFSQGSLVKLSCGERLEEGQLIGREPGDIVVQIGLNLFDIEKVEIRFENRFVKRVLEVDGLEEALEGCSVVHG